MSRRITAALTAAALTLVLATGGASGGASSPGQQPPRNLTPPSVSGTARVPNTVSSSTGTWQGKGLKFAYQWLRCDSSGASCGAISGATASTKTLTTADVNYTLRVIVTATNRNGSTAATSAQTAVVAPAASAPPPPPPPPPPPAVPPSNMALPGISGTARQGLTLNASTGSWSGTTPMTYAYQWQRCDSSGGACAAISGAAAATYLLVLADVGRTMRVTVTASNSAGSATASSVATAIVTGVSAYPWWSRRFESPEALPQPYPYCCGTYWDTLLTSSASTGAQVVDPTNAANSVFRSHAADSTNYADWSLVTQNTTNAHAFQGSDVWVKFRIYFPTDFKPTGYRAGQPNSEFNWIHEFHEDSQYRTKCASEDPGNIALGVLDSSAYTTLRWRLQIYAGQQASTTNCTGSIGDRDVNGPAIQLGHWYTLLEHVHFSAGSDGLYQLWIDGVQAFSVDGPTLYRHPDGTTEVAYTHFGDYRASGDSWAVRTTWPSNVYYDDIAEGSSQASVGG